MNNLQKAATFSLALMMTVLFAGIAFSQDLVVYSARKEHLIKPVFDRYTQKPASASSTSPIKHRSFYSA